MPHWFAKFLGYQPPIRDNNPDISSLLSKLDEQERTNEMVNERLSRVETHLGIDDAVTKLTEGKGE